MRERRERKRERRKWQRGREGLREREREEEEKYGEIEKRRRTLRFYNTIFENKDFHIGKV